jgi:tuftelin-interacting protein 11
MPGLTPWTSVLGSTLQHTLVKHMLPRLSKYLDTEFDVNPAEQDQTMPAFEAAVSWVPAFTNPKAMGQLLVASFFPKWLHTLHVWLTSDSPDFAEVNEWLGWWEEQIPETLRNLPPITLEFGKALKMISQARQLADDQRMNLPEVRAEKIELVKDEKRKSHKKTPAKPAEQVLETSFKDIVESWCEDESLLLVPLREAHKSTGVPLFRITASATGKGGVVVYFKGNVLWARERRAAVEDGEHRESWRPIELGDALVKLAEKR